MKPDISQLSPEERDLRLTALVMGELPEAEAAAWRDAMATDSELRKSFEQRKRTMELLGETVTAHAGVPENAPVRLSEDRRQSLLAKFAAAYVEAKTAVQRKREPRSLWYVPLSIAAILIALLGVAVAYIGGFGFQRREVSLAVNFEDASAAAENHAPFALLRKRRGDAPSQVTLEDLKQQSASEGEQSSRWDRPVSLAKGGNLQAGEGDTLALTLGEKNLNGRAQGLDDLAKSAPTSRDYFAKSDGSDLLGVEPGLTAPRAPSPVATPLPTPAPAARANRTDRSLASTDRPPTSSGTRRAGATVGDPVASTPPPASLPASGLQSESATVNFFALSDREASAGQTRFKSGVDFDQDAAVRIPALKQEQEVLRGESKMATGQQNEFRSFFDSNRTADERYDVSRVDEQIATGKDFAAGHFGSSVSGTITPSLDGKNLDSGVIAPQSQLYLNYSDALSSTVNGQSFGGGRGGGRGGRSRAIAATTGGQFAGVNGGLAGGGTVTGGGGVGSLGGGGLGRDGAIQNDWFFKQGGQRPNVASGSKESLESLHDFVAPAESAEESRKKAETLAEGVYSVNAAGYVNLAGIPTINESQIQQQSATQLGAIVQGRDKQLAINGPAPATQPTVGFEIQSPTPAQPEQAGKEIAQLDALQRVPEKSLKEMEKRLVESDAPVAAKPASPPPVPQPEILTRENTFSTFSLNVADVSYKLAAASLERGVMPDAASIRVEEFINAFDYRDPQPAPGMPVAFASERARYPFAHNRDLLRLAVKTAARGREASKPLNVVVLLDNSGSMERADRVRIVQECLRTLARQFQPQDKLSVVTFARTARLWVDGVSGTNAAAVAEQVGNLTPQGGTNLEDALDLAYRTATRHVQAQSVSRVVLLTDGAANLGNVDPQALKAKVEAYRKQGIALDSFGVGWEGYNDELLETLTRNGDGRYGFINTPEEAGPRFAAQLAGALQVAASDVKVQVEFNPKRVSSWRQVGYAKHQLTKEQFRDNTVDAAEIGAAEAGNALYVIETKPLGEGPVATVRVRYKVPGTSDYYEHEWPVAYTPFVPPAESASPSMRLAASSAAFAEWLAGSPFAGDVTTDRLLKMVNGVPESFGADPRPKQLEWMIRQAKSISGK